MLGRAAIDDPPFVSIPKRQSVIAPLEGHGVGTHLEILQSSLRIRIIHYNIENLPNPSQKKLSELPAPRNSSTDLKSHNVLHM